MVKPHRRVAVTIGGAEMEWSGAGKECPRVGVIGLGYVGLPLVLQFCRGGCHTLGLEIDEKKVELLNASCSYIRHIASEDIAEWRRAGRLEATTDFSRVKELDACLICVPTPLNRHREPDMQFVLSSARAIGPHLQRGQLIVLESTTYPGTTEEDFRPILEELSGLRAGIDFHLAFSPEREDPGNLTFKTSEIPKVVGGMTPACTEVARILYGRAVKRTIAVGSTQAAEACKLMENIFRCVNIAMVNELKIVFDRMNIDIWEVIEAAKSKPFGFMPFYPGPGLGGHCIPIDPFYLAWKARQYNVPTKFIELAGEVNAAMPRYVVTRVMEALSDRGKALKNAHVLLLGLAYKKDIDDTRESASYVLWELLEERGANVAYHDPFIPTVSAGCEHGKYSGIESTPLTADNLRKADVVLIATDHTSIDYELVVNNALLVVDTRNACAKVTPALRKGKVVRA
jgi:UDP-N-acetyl-D-glucosamine dehydrogenase